MLPLAAEHRVAAGRSGPATRGSRLTRAGHGTTRGGGSRPDLEAALVTSPRPAPSSTRSSSNRRWFRAVLRGLRAGDAAAAGMDQAVAMLARAASLTGGCTAVGGLAVGRSDRLRSASRPGRGRPHRVERPSDDEGPDRRSGQPRGRGCVRIDVGAGWWTPTASFTLPGGAHWIERAGVPGERLLDYAEAMPAADRRGRRWARDVGSVRRDDPVDGRERADGLGGPRPLAETRGLPHVRAAGTWIIAGGCCRPLDPAPTRMR